MIIQKKYQGTVPENKILDTHSNSNTDTYSCNYTNKANTYSTNEIRIGTWIDGKPLYRKTFEHTMGTTLNSWELIGPVSNVKIPTRMYGVFNNIDVFFHVPFFDGNNNVILYCNTSNKNFYIMHNYDYASNKAGTYVIEYTKTTD